MKDFLILLVVIGGMITFGACLISETMRHKEECEKRGGVWLNEDNTCVKGERIDLTN